MKPTVYIETSIVSYLTAWPSSDDLRKAHQELTKSWWRERSGEFELYTSRFVIDEAGAGDSKAAAERMRVLQSIRRLDIFHKSNLWRSIFCAKEPCRQKPAWTRSIWQLLRPMAFSFFLLGIARISPMRFFGIKLNGRVTSTVISHPGFARRLS